MGCMVTYEGVPTSTVNQAEWVPDPFCPSTIDTMLNVKCEQDLIVNISDKTLLRYIDLVKFQN